VAEATKVTPTTIEPEAATAEVEDLEGNRRRLAELWAERPVVLVFLRHFG
jgi:hypothetical protein